MPPTGGGAAGVLKLFGKTELHHAGGAAQKRAKTSNYSAALRLAILFAGFPGAMPHRRQVKALKYKKEMT
jgi:hypothetical protein